MSHSQNIGLSTALVGSLWALHKEKCSACSQVPKIGEFTLSRLGVGFYSLALLSSLASVEQVKILIKAAAYIHGALVTHMIITNNLCNACLMTAFGSILAARM